MNLFLTLAFSALALFQQHPDDGRGQDLFTMEWHAARRQALMEKVTKGVVVLRGAGESNDYREFRQDNNFWYFTGVTTPGAVLVLVPDGRQYFFVPAVSPNEERWLGDLIDPEESKEITGLVDCREIKELDGLLQEFAGSYGTFYVQEQPAENWQMSRDQLRSAARSVASDPFDGRETREARFAAKLREKYEVQTKDITVLLDALRVVKTPEEVEAMREACRISGLGHERAMRTARAGEYEWQLAARMTGTFLENGARSYGYAAIVGSGPKACILHYNENVRRLQSGDVVMIDFGAEFNHYVADISRTWPVDKHFTDRQREVYQAVYDAQEAAFKECKPGSNLMQVHEAAAGVLRERGFGRAFWHGTSHWLGMATHDVGQPMASFESGMVFTVEPGVYLPEEGIGVRIEDVVAITEDGYDLLSSMIPRSVEEIEALRGSAP